jgi:hypothetical protein
MNSTYRPSLKLNPPCKLTQPLVKKKAMRSFIRPSRWRPLLPKLKFLGSGACQPSLGPFRISAESTNRALENVFVECGVAAVLGQCAPSPCAGAMHAIDLGMPPHTRPRQGRRRPTPRCCATGASGTNIRQCWSDRRKATAIDKNSSKVCRRED